MISSLAIVTTAAATIRSAACGVNSILLDNKKGQTSAIYGFISTILPIASCVSAYRLNPNRLDILTLSPLIGLAFSKPVANLISQWSETGEEPLSLGDIFQLEVIGLIEGTATLGIASFLASKVSDLLMTLRLPIPGRR